LGAVLAGSAPSLLTVILFKLFQGIGAAMIQANAMAILTSAFPYASPDVRIQEWEQSAKTLKDQHVDLTFLNCMGMDLEMKNVFQSVTGKPVVLASSVVARIVDEMVSGSDIPAVRPKETSVAI